LTDPSNPPASAELHDYCRAHLAPHKTPRFWYRAHEFPLTGSGKIQKFRVVELIGDGAYELVT
jgi:acyl-coenzyme A synthetase/AMP-(fatty) acid ligase